MLSCFSRTFLILVFGSACAAEDVRKISILHSNDLHARLLPDSNGTGGWAHLSTAVRREREGCKHCVYVNAGDLVQGTPVSTLFQGMPLYEIANGFKFDVASLGNHEFDYGHKQVGKFVKKAKFPIAAANIIDDAGASITGRRYVIKQVNGLRVGFIGGVMTNLVDGFLAPGKIGHWKVTPVVEAVRQTAKEIATSADLIVVVAHIHQAEGSEILRAVPEVSAVIEGHNHQGRQELEVHESRVAANCRAWGVELCRLDLEFDLTSRKLVSWNWKRIPVRTSEYEPDPSMKAAIDKWEKKVSELVDVPVGESSRDWTRPDLKPLIEQAIREEMAADFSYMNNGGIRDTLKRGTILARHIWNMLPFDNQMVVATVRGSEVPENLRNGRALDPARTYRIAMADFNASNKTERERIGLGDIQFQSTGKVFREVMIEWIRKKKTL